MVTRGQVHLDQAATQFSVAYRNSNYIADIILPKISVTKDTGAYFKFSKSNWFRDEAAIRAWGTRAVEGEWGMDTQGSYTCLQYAFSMGLPDELRENQDSPMDVERTTVEFVTDKILLAQEKRVADYLFNGTTFSGYTATAAALTGGTDVAWDTDATSDPVKDIEVMRNIIIKSIGQKPNVMLVGQAVHTVLRVHSGIREIVKYTAAEGVIPNAELARLFDVDKYLVGTAIADSSEEGTTASYDYIWGKYVLLAYVNPRPALMSPSLGYIIESKPMYAERFREDQEKRDKFAVYQTVDEVICAADAGYLLTSVVS